MGRSLLLTESQRDCHRTPGQFMIDSLRRRTVSIFILLCWPGGSTTSGAAPLAEQLTRVQAADLQREARVVVDLLQNHHYGGRAFRELDSATMIGRYASELDPRAEFFELADVTYVHRRFDRTFKSVYLFRGDLQPAFEIFDLFATRARTRLEWVQKRLDRDFDFTIDETFQEREKPEPFATPADADRHWELRLKSQLLGERLRGRSPADATAEIKRYYDRAARAIAAYDPLAVRERFFDAIIRSYDPHSGYFSSDSSREFAVEMEKAVVGLGLELRREEGRCVVSSVQPGGPADLAGVFELGDTLTAIAEGADGPWTQLASLRLREIVTLMRGAPGSQIRVTYQHAGQEESRQITFERQRVELAADRARGAVSQVPVADGATRRIGVIDLPSFYAAGTDSSLSSASRDVRELLGQMDVATLDGLVIDLRGNPGGALTEAVALSEIFLPRGVMMLSRGPDGKVKPHPIKEGTPVYLGPLIVLISDSSASASEVFSGAMRYHRRAVIVGAPATFGKGTMQAYIELSRMGPKDAKDWGTLRVTTEKFFQPDGSPVQQSGVAAHVILPDLHFGPAVTREKDLPGALPAETVTPPADLAPATTGGAGVSPELVAYLNAEASRHATEMPEWELGRAAHELAKGGDQSKEPRALVADTREKEKTEKFAAWHALELRQRAQATADAYPTQPYEVAAALKLLNDEDTRLRAAAATPRSYFVVTTDQGRRRKLDVAAVNFPRYELDAVALAAALPAAGGPAWEANAIARFLREAGLLRYKTPASLEALARTCFPVDETTPFHPQMETLLQEIARLDGDILRERPSLDVELREAQRLASAWADWNRREAPRP